jgi:hypothetical protein
VGYPKRLGLFRQPQTGSSLPVGERSISSVNRKVLLIEKNCSRKSVAGKLQQKKYGRKIAAEKVR